MTTKTTDEIAQEHGGIVAFRATAELIERAEAQAAAEGITRSDVARRALLRDLARQGAPA
jgi:hypothetical protein